MIDNSYVFSGGEEDVIRKKSGDWKSKREETGRDTCEK
jgi:hypothetical protein